MYAKKKSESWEDRFKALEPRQRAHYLFNTMMFPKGVKRPKEKGSGERAPLKVGPGKKVAPSYKLGKPYKSKKQRGL